jgi:hypothetical protein
MNNCRHFCINDAAWSREDGEGSEGNKAFPFFATFAFFARHRSVLSGEPPPQLI